MKRISALLTLLFATSVSSAIAQDRGQSTSNFPPACQAAAQASGHKEMVDKVNSQHEQTMKQGMQGMGQMTTTQKGLHEAMMKMHGPMMLGMLAKDADVSWVCAMIPHHQGAIDMARAGLLGADNAESKRLAEETIRSNEREIAKLTEWVAKNAERENRNETSGSSAK